MTINRTGKKILSPETQREMDALMRAARDAHLIAHQTGTKVVLADDNGKVIEVDPDPDMYGGLENEVGSKVNRLYRGRGYWEKKK